MTVNEYQEAWTHAKNLIDAAAYLKRFTGKCRLDWLRINENPSKDLPQLGYIECINEAMPDLKKAYHHADEAARAMLNVLAPLRESAEKEYGLGSAPALMMDGRPSEIDPPEPSEGEGWKQG